MERRSKEKKNENNINKNTKMIITQYYGIITQLMTPLLIY